MARMMFYVDLREVEVEVDLESGRIEHVWHDGFDFADKSVEELIIAMMGGPDRFAMRIYKEQELRRDD